MTALQRRFRSLPARYQRGYLLLRLGMAAIILAILAVILLERLHYYQEVAEKLRMETVLRSLDTTLKLRMGELAIANKAYRWGDLAGQNPFDWLQQKPPDYCGALAGDDTPAPGCWGYRGNSGELVYRVNLDGHLRTEGGGDLLRFRLEAAAGEDAAVSVKMVPIERYRWLEP